MSQEKPKAATKTAIYTELAEKTELSRKQVAAVFDELSAIIKKELSKNGPGVVSIAGLLKLKRVVKPATKARPGINPRTKEPITIKAKPKTTTVKAYALKTLKEMVK